jgi:hypothetical protein
VEVDLHVDTLAELVPLPVGAVASKRFQLQTSRTQFRPIPAASVPNEDGELIVRFTPRNRTWSPAAFTNRGVALLYAMVMSGAAPAPPPPPPPPPPVDGRVTAVAAV